MRIHSIALQNYRGVTAAEVRFPLQGVTIIEGDNEVGKTSMFEALDLLLSLPDDSTASRVKDVKTVGSDAGATVEVDMESGPYRFTYRKRWHRKAETILEIVSPHREQLSGREAHDRVRVILEETLDADLWAALRFRQGAELQQAQFAGASLGRALDRAAGGAVASDGEDHLWDRIVAENGLYWTGTGRASRDRQTANERVAELEDQVKKVSGELAGLEQDAERVQTLLSSASEIAERQAQHELKLEEFEGAWAKIEEQQRAVARLSEIKDADLLRLDQAATANTRRLEIIEDATAAVEAQDRLTAAIEEKKPLRAAQEKRSRELNEAITECKKLVEAAEAAHRQAVADRECRRQELDRDLLSERFGRGNPGLERPKAATAILETNAVDDDALETIEAAHLQVVRAEAAADSGAAAVTVEALEDMELLIDGEEVDLATGGSKRQTVVDTVEIEFPRVLRVTVQAGADSQTRHDTVERAREQLTEACRQAGVTTVDEARASAAQRRAAARDVGEAGKALGQDLRDLTPEELTSKHQQLASAVTSFLAFRDEVMPLPADLGAAEAVETECERKLSDRRDELAQREAERDEKSAAAQEDVIDDATDEAHLQQAHAQVERTRNALTAARAALSDTDLAEKLSDAEKVASDRATELEALEKELASKNPTTAEDLLGNAREVKKRMASELHANTEETRTLRTRLEIKGEEGLANQLDEVASELQRTTTARDRVEARAAAAKLLFDTFAKHRAQARSRYQAPFRDKIEELGRIVFGPDFEVELDEDLSIARRTLEGQTLPFGALSTGAREQLCIISLLACAAIIADDGGTPVVLDDALGWSDPGRLELMGAVIAVASRSCQIVVLTCTPGRYESVGNANVLRLPVMLEGADS